MTLTKLQARFLDFSRLFSAGIILLGLFVLAGWTFGIEFLKRILPGVVAMNPMTAVCFIASGASLLIHQYGLPSFRHSFAGLLALVPAVIGSVKLLGILMGFDLRVDQLFFAGKIEVEIAGISNRMAPNTAFNFALSGVALLMLNLETRRKRMPAQYLAAIVTMISLLSLLGYLYKVKSFYGILTYIPMAIHSAIGFLLLALAILFYHPGRGLMLVVTGTHSGSATLRSLLPAAILIPAILGYIRLYSQWEGGVTLELGTALLILSLILIFIVLIWYNGLSLNRRDLQRHEAEQQMIKMNEELEKRVEERTEEIVKEQQKLMDRAAYLEARTSEILDVLLKSTMKDFSEKVTVTERGDELDAIAVGINTLNEELQDHISRVEESNRMLEAANKEMEAFSYSVSHDLRAPLRAIHGYAKIIMEDYINHLDEEARRLMQVVLDNARKMGNLIDELLAFARLGKKELVKQHIFMQELVLGVMEEIKKQEGDRRMEINLEKLPDMEGDSATLRQVWVNLISNAFKYTRPKDKTVIHIGAEEREHDVVFFVEDNGVGFDMQYYNKLFGVFQRLHSSDEFEGTGVGLAIVHRIVTRHGGTVWGEGKPGEGAVFKFTLPKNSEL